MTHALNHPIPPTPPAERAPSATAVPRSAPPPPTPDDTWAVLVQLRQTTAVRGANKRHTARTSHFFRALDAILRKHEDVLGKYVREDHMDAIPFVLDRAASSGGGHSSTTTGGRDLYFRNKQHARLFIGFLKKFFVLQVKTPSIDKLNGTIPKNRLLKISVELCAYMKTDLCLLQDGSMVSKKKKMPDRTGVRGLCLIVGHWGNVMQFYDPKVSGGESCMSGRGRGNHGHVFENSWENTYVNFSSTIFLELRWDRFFSQNAISRYLASS